MRRLLLLLTLLLSLPALADGVDEMGREAEGIQRNIEQVRRVLQERMGGLPGIDQQTIETMRRKVMVLAADKTFLKAAGDLWQSPNRNTLLVAELIFAVFMYFFKAWRQAKASNWFTRLLTGLSLSLVTWAGVGFVLPAIILGAPYRIVVTTLWRAFTS
jgi:hypothetical protein